MVKMLREETMLEKLNKSAPYNIFYNVIPDLSHTAQQSNAIRFSDLLCPSLGNLKCSLQMTARIDIKWLMEQYEIRNVGSKPLTIFYSHYQPEMEEYIEKYLPNVTQHCFAVAKPENYGSCHAKLAIYVYEDNSLRIVVSTANLDQSQWDHYNHGFWVSPPCPPLPENSSDDGESPTKFKSTLLNYLGQYEQPTILDPWIEQIRKADFRDVKVFLLTSTPGSHPPQRPESHLQQIEGLLKKYCVLPEHEESIWPIIAQVSCLGQYGESSNVWLRSTFLGRLACHERSEATYTPTVPLKIIFPTWKQVKNGLFDDKIAGEGSKYLRAIHDKQRWLQNYLYEWKADNLERTSVMPHTKSYCRVSPLGDKMAWFLLTSANVIRGAWGQEDNFNKGNIHVKNYEAGVMFIPKFFGEDFFKIKSSGNVEEKPFPLIYDLPLRKYRDRDHPWTTFAFKMTQKRFSTTKLQN